MVVRARRVGYAAVERPVRVRDNATAPVELRLKVTAATVVLLLPGVVARCVPTFGLTVVW